MSWLSDYIKRTPHETQQDHRLAKERAKAMEDKVQQGIADGSIFLPGYPKTWEEKQIALDAPKQALQKKQAAKTHEDKMEHDLEYRENFEREERVKMLSALPHIDERDIAPSTMESLANIQEKMGDEDIMLDGHGFFDLEEDEEE